MFWGQLTRLGCAAALATALADQASKLWVINVLHIRKGMREPLTRFLDLTLYYNRGISYGLFQQESPLGQWVLLAVAGVAVALLWIWLTRTGSRLTALSLGLIIGGAVANAIDRFFRDGVADFILFHITTETIHFEWYAFNLADAAIVAGVAGLLFESLVGERAAKAPRSPT